MEYSKCCRDCVLNHECLMQDNGDVESCEEYLKEKGKEIVDYGKNDDFGDRN